MLSKEQDILINRRIQKEVKRNNNIFKYARCNT